LEKACYLCSPLQQEAFWKALLTQAGRKGKKVLRSIAGLKKLLTFATRSETKVSKAENKRVLIGRTGGEEKKKKIENCLRIRKDFRPLHTENDEAVGTESTSKTRLKRQASIQREKFFGKVL
jgi:hypothetical protein